jgi:hypothetical protein
MNMSYTEAMKPMHTFLIQANSLKLLDAYQKSNVSAVRQAVSRWFFT